MGLGNVAGGGPVMAIFPRDGEEFRLDPDRPSNGHGMRLRVSGATGRTVRLRLDGTVRATGVGAASFVWTATPGTHVLEAVDDQVMTDAASFVVR